MTITREGNFTKSPVNVLEEINIFEGHQNRITFQQVYSKTFKCVYQLELYPFDTQVKTLTLIPTTLHGPEQKPEPELRHSGRVVHQCNVLKELGLTLNMV